MAAFGAVLIVDDEPVILAVASIALAPYFGRVVTAPNAADAFALWYAHDGHFDLLVTDIVMPGSSGIELADSLWAVRPELKVLFISGASDPNEIGRRLVRGKSAFLPKPFTLGQITAIAERLLRDG